MNKTEKRPGFREQQTVNRIVNECYGLGFAALRADLR